MVECVCVCNVLVFTLSQIMVDWVYVCNLRASLLCLHYHRSWLSVYVCVMFLCLHCHRSWLIGYVCVMFLFLYCVYTVTEHG